MHSVVLATLCIASCAVVAAPVIAIVTIKRRYSTRKNRQQRGSGKKTAVRGDDRSTNPSKPGSRKIDQHAGPTTFKRGMVEHEYLPLIPKQERLRVQSLIQEVHSSRGWGYEPRSFDTAWKRVLEAAETPAGGSWVQGFDPMVHLTPARLAALARVIDTELYGGAVFGRRPGPGALGFAALDWTPGDDDWMSCYDEKRDQVVFKRPKWSQARFGHLSDSTPVNCEGVACTSALQVLAHTLGHELVHALVVHRLPDIDASSPAYLPDARHGPIFCLLNKHILGHGSEVLRYTFSPAPGQQPDERPATPAFACDVGHVATGADGHLWIVRLSGRGSNVWAHHARVDEPQALYLVSPHLSDRPDEPGQTDVREEGARKLAPSQPMTNSSASTHRKQVAGPVGLTAADFAGLMQHGTLAPAAAAASTAPAARTVAYIVRVTARTVDVYARTRGKDVATGVPEDELVHTLVGHVRVLVAGHATSSNGWTSINAMSAAEQPCTEQPQDQAPGPLDENYPMLLGTSTVGASTGTHGTQHLVPCAGLLVEAAPSKWVFVHPGSIFTFTASPGEQIHRLQACDGASGGGEHLVAHGTHHVFYLDRQQCALLSEPDKRKGMKVAVVHR